MLQHGFFTFTALQTEGDMVKTTIKLTPAHPIFMGHFPGEPVLPGACMVQMVKEMVDVYLSKETRLVKASDLKFLSFIHPDGNESIQMEIKMNIEEELIRVVARLLDHEVVLFKFKGSFAQR